MTRVLSIQAFVIAVALASSAAAADDSSSWAPWPFHKTDDVGKPDKVVALWSDTVMTRPGEMPIRGFGGRLMFYEGKSDTPVKVDGTLVVYAFDETNRDPNNVKPDCKFVIPAEQLKNHYSKSKVGHSYSVWIPWDQAGGTQKEITLIARLEPKSGSPVIGEQCKEILPGAAPQQKGLPTSMVATNRVSTTANGGYPANAGAWNAANPNGAQPMTEQTADGVRQVSYETPQQQNAAPQGQEWSDHRMATSTIAVPNGLALRQALSVPQAIPSPAPARQWPAPSPATQPQQTPGPMFQPNPPRQNLQPQAGYQPGRPWVPAEQPSRLSRDRAASQQRLEAQAYAPATQPAAQYSNAAPTATPSVPQSQY